MSLIDFVRGTHGYMAPEVLSKGTAYDSSADWFSFGCMLYKLLKGHSPFRQHKTKDKHEIDRMTLTMVCPIPYFHSLLHECDAMTEEVAVNFPLKISRML